MVVVKVVLRIQDRWHNGEREHWLTVWLVHCLWRNVIFHQRERERETHRERPPLRRSKAIWCLSLINFYRSKYGCALDAHSSPRNYGRRNAVHHFYRTRESKWCREPLLPRMPVFRYTLRHAASRRASICPTCTSHSVSLRWVPGARVWSWLSSSDL